jgi:hypothetical protein
MDTDADNVIRPPFAATTRIPQITTLARMSCDTCDWEHEYDPTHTLQITLAYLTANSHLLNVHGNAAEG